MRLVSILVASFALCAAAIAQDAAVPEKPEVSARRALIISVDGLRPDVMLRAKAPTLRGLMDRGAFTLWAQTTAVSLTLPSHCSMLTGVRPQKHQIEWNNDLKFAEPVYPKYPTIFELAHAAGFSTGMVVGKDKFNILKKPGTLDSIFVPEKESVTDADVLREALRVIDEKPPQVLFVHLPTVDQIGHAQGWGTPAQVEAVETADSAIGEILAALAKKGVLDATLVIVSADHGGAGRDHGADDPRCRHIPWIAVGPSVRKNFDLTRIAPLTVCTEDTFATTADWLGLKLNPNLEGRAVREIYDGPDAVPPSGRGISARR